VPAEKKQGVPTELTILISTSYRHKPIYTILNQSTVCKHQKQQQKVAAAAEESRGERSGGRHSGEAAKQNKEMCMDPEIT